MRPSPPKRSGVGVTKSIYRTHCELLRAECSLRQRNPDLNPAKDPETGSRQSGVCVLVVSDSANLWTVVR